MMKNKLFKKAFIVGIILLFIGVSIVSGFNIQLKETEKASRGSFLYVGGSGPGNYSKIQDAINDSGDGDTVYVFNGIYYENVRINKTINLIGEDKNTTVIDGNKIGDVIFVLADFVNISGFTIQNAGSYLWKDAGIELRSYFNFISGNIISNNSRHGIFTKASKSDHNIICKNIIIDNDHGVTLDCSVENEIYENYIFNNRIGIFIGVSSLLSGDVFLPLSWKSLPFEGYVNNIFGNIIKNNDIGIDIEPGCFINIFENDILGNGIGIFLCPPSVFYCNYNYIYRNNIIDNNDFGIRLLQPILRSTIYGNEIYYNNFINNGKNAYGNGKNIWKENYWDDWIGLKYKFLRFIPYLIPWIFFKNIDWHPILEPYDI